MKNDYRTPTARMIEKLRDCHQLQLNNDPGTPCTEEHLKGSLAGLYKRGYVQTKEYLHNGKKLMSLYVTDKGIQFLKQVEGRV